MNTLFENLQMLKEASTSEIYDYIKNCTNADELYDNIRKLLIKLDSEGKYPEDHVINKIQRLADAKYSELTDVN